LIPGSPPVGHGVARSGGDGAELAGSLVHAVVLGGVGGAEIADARGDGRQRVEAVDEL
jgi:hypothetical protein